MIFVTVGMRLPFDRLIRWMDDWAAVHPEEEVLGQILHRTPDCSADNYKPNHFDARDEMAPDAFEAAFERARGIVSHAGTGTMMTAMRLRKPLIMVPRRADLREIRNDHQLATVGFFRTVPGVVVADTAEELSTALDTLVAGTAQPVDASMEADPELIGTIRDAIQTAR